MHAPIRPIRGRWPAPLERRLARFFWSDPAVVVKHHPTPDEYTAAMSAFHVGDTIKITGSNRHPAADALVTDNLDLTGGSIVDIGASDGSTAVDLINKLPTFKSYTIADLYLHISATRLGSHVLFRDGRGGLILIAGRRLVAWPSLSRFVRLAYSPLIRRAATHAAESEQVLLMNPAARDLIASDERVSCRVHDVFQPWDGPSPDVIKVANLLRRLYFTDAEIRSALRVLLNNLAEGGHLLVVDNPRIEGIVERAGLYRRSEGRFVLVDQTTHPAEIDDLVRTVATDDPGNPVDAQVDAAG